MLQGIHIDPLMPEVPGDGTIAERADALARALFRTRAPAFALIGHSMGGLDARYLITHLDPDRRVKSLITVATPHQGTPLARWFLESPGPIEAYIRRIGRTSLGELTVEARAAMPIPDREDVDYSSYSGWRPPAELPFWLRHCGRITGEDNDGMVPVQSAEWGRFRGLMHADHIELIGWSVALPDRRTGRPFDYLPFWARAASEALAAAKQKLQG